MKIILLYGGRSAEHEVSLLSAFSVVNAVYYNYYQVQLVMITKEGRWLKGPLLSEATNVTRYFGIDQRRDQRGRNFTWGHL